MSTRARMYSTLAAPLSSAISCHRSLPVTLASTLSSPAIALDRPCACSSYRRARRLLPTPTTRVTTSSATSPAPRLRRRSTSVRPGLLSDLLVLDLPGLICMLPSLHLLTPSKSQAPAEIVIHWPTCILPNALQVALTMPPRAMNLVNNINYPAHASRLNALM